MSRRPPCSRYTGACSGISWAGQAGPASSRRITAASSIAVQAVSSRPSLVAYRRRTSGPLPRSSTLSRIASLGSPAAMRRGPSCRRCRNCSYRKGTPVYTRISPASHVRAHGGNAGTMIDHGSPVPLHEQLTALLRGQIESGELQGRVPSILTLAQEYGISHRTAQRSLETLRDEGTIISVRGKGYYVAERK